MKALPEVWRKRCQENWRSTHPANCQSFPADLWQTAKQTTIVWVVFLLSRVLNGEGLSRTVPGRGFQTCGQNNDSLTVAYLSVAATLTIADSGLPIVLRTKYILLQRNGGLRIGSETKPHMSPLEIILYSRLDGPHVHPIFGRKFIGVDSTASIEIHGPRKQSWTFLTNTLLPGTCTSIVV